MSTSGLPSAAAEAMNGAINGAMNGAAPWIERLARLGFLAKALLYMTVGALAASAALGMGGKAAGSRDAMTTLVALTERTLGRVLLGVIALGLAGYGLWRLVEGVLDPERHGRDAKGLAKRVRAVATGLIHAALAYSALRIALGMAIDKGGDEAQQTWTARTLAVPGGEFVLWGIAGAIIGYGLHQLYCAWHAKLDRRLSVPARHGRWVISASRFGIASRGIVFGMIGVLLGRAVAQRDASEVGGVSESLRELFTFGRWPFLVIAVGLIAYGFYQALNAKYRRISVT